MTQFFSLLGPLIRGGDSGPFMAMFLSQSTKPHFSSARPPADPNDAVSSCTIPAPSRRIALVGEYFATAPDDPAEFRLLRVTSWLRRGDYLGLESSLRIAIIGLPCPEAYPAVDFSLKAVGWHCTQGSRLGRVPTTPPLPPTPGYTLVPVFLQHRTVPPLLGTRYSYTTYRYLTVADNYSLEYLC